jgi:Restriction endonuclease
MKKWQKFEELAAEIQSKLSPESTVIHNDKIRGNITGTIRQIDISIRTKVGQFEMLIVIDCKDYKRPVDVKSIGEVMELSEDVGANKTAIIAANGFTSSAKSRAKAAGIDLLTLIDSGEHDWQQFVSIPAIVEFTHLKSYQFEFSSTGAFGRIEYPENERDFKLYNERNENIGSVGELFDKLWENYIDWESYQPDQGLQLSNENIYFKTTTGFSKVDIKVFLTLEKVICAGSIPLSKASGFKDEIRGHFTSSGFTTERFNPHDIYDTWERYASAEEVPFKPVFTLKFK